MADYNSSLPVRTETNGDVVGKLVDGLVNTQYLSIDAAGLIGSKLYDAAGTGLTSQLNGAQQALDVMDQSNGPVTPGTVAGFSSLIGGQYNTTLPTLTNGQQAALQTDANGRLYVVNGNFPTTVDTNYGTVGANTIRTASQIGNATGAADFNYGTVGAQTLRTAAQIGNATGAADFNAGATGAQTLRTTSNQGTPNTIANAWPTSITDGTDTLAVNTDGSINVVIADATPGTPINDFNTATVASAATSNHDYTVTAAKTFYLNQIEASGTGKVKIEVQVETGVATGTFNTRWVQFNSTADTNMTIHIDNPIAVAAGVRVRVIRTNRDNQSQDIYSTISGYELP